MGEPPSSCFAARRPTRLAGGGARRARASDARERILISNHEQSVSLYSFSLQSTKAADKDAFWRVRPIIVLAGSDERAKFFECQAAPSPSSAHKLGATEMAHEHDRDVST